jgi:hypothetical protein
MANTWTRWEKLKHRTKHLWYAFVPNFRGMRNASGSILLGLKCGLREARGAWRSVNVWPGW